jgi:hypothetical protein
MRDGTLSSNISVPLIQHKENNEVWKYWCKSIGTKAFDENNKADTVAIIRTVWIVIHIITCFAIILNAWRHW